MTEDKSFIQKAFEAFKDYPKANPNNGLVILATEFNSEGYPTAKVRKVYGSPAVTLASIALLRIQLDELEEQILDALDTAEHMSDSLVDLCSKLGITEKEDMEELYKLFKNFEGDGQETMEDLLKTLKRKFGK